eukprot:scaffold335060_cov139-Cyclotella_meneghiniana.AAC.1
MESSIKWHIVSLEQSVTTAMTTSLPNMIKSAISVQSSEETIAEEEVPFLVHVDFESIMGRPFLLPPDSYLTKNQMHYPPTPQHSSNTRRIKWILNLDGWMMLHDLKGWMKIDFLMG